MQDGVHRLQDRRGRDSGGHVALAERPGPHQFGRKCAVERRRHALARDVAEHHHELVGERIEIVVKVAAELTCGVEPGRDVEAADSLRHLLRQQRRLHPLRGSQLALDA